MQALRRYFIFIAMIFMLAACSDSSGITGGGPVIDASSDAAMEASLEAMTGHLSRDDKQKVGQALATIMMIEGFSMMGEDISETEMGERLRDGVDGLTAMELIDKAEKLTADMKSRQ